MSISDIVNFVKYRGCCIFLGIILIISSLLKSLDPVGVSYKIEEYINLFCEYEHGIDTIVIAISLCIIEMVLGLCLIVNMAERIALVITLFMLSCFTIIIYMAVAMSDNIINCGCFGDAIPLSNEATFVKNIVLLLFTIVPLCKSKNKKIINVASLFKILLISIIIPLYSYFYLPPYEFLPYRIGKHLDGSLQIYDSDFNNIENDYYRNGKPTYILIVRDDVNIFDSKNLSKLYDLYRKAEINMFIATDKSDILIDYYDDVPVFYMDNIVLKSMLRSSFGIVSLNSHMQVVGKWNLRYTPYKFNRHIGNEYYYEIMKSVFIIGFWFIFFYLFIFKNIRNSIKEKDNCELLDNYFKEQ